MVQCGVLKSVIELALSSNAPSPVKSQVSMFFHFKLFSHINQYIYLPNYNLVTLCFGRPHKRKSE
jgi:hypothetical protein